MVEKKNIKKAASFEKLVIKSGLGFLIQSKLLKPLFLVAGDFEIGVPFKNPVLVLGPVLDVTVYQKLYLRSFL